VVKCPAFWRKAWEFKCRGDFEGFMDWCEVKSYKQVRRDWNTLDTFQIIAEKLGKPISEVLKFENLSEGALLPIVEQRTYTGKHETAPSPLQERAIEILLPKIESGEKVTRADAVAALREASGKPAPRPERVRCEYCLGEFGPGEVKTLRLCAICSAEFLVWMQERR